MGKIINDMIKVFNQSLKDTLIIENKNDSFKIIANIDEIALDMQDTNIEIDDLTSQTGPNTGVPNITVTKSANRTTVSLNDKVEYTILISNTTGLPITGVSLIDILPINCSLVNNSIIINGMASSQNTLLGGIKLTDMSVNETQTIQYSVTFYNLPMLNPVQINPQVNYDFISPNTGSKVNQTFIGTSTVLNVVNDPLGRVALYLNTNTAISKDKILYTLIVKNNGNNTATNIVLKYPIPQGVQYIPNSLMVSGNSVIGDITQGVPLSNITMGQEVLITFQVSVN